MYNKRREKGGGRREKGEGRREKREERRRVGIISSYRDCDDTHMRSVIVSSR
jgi:hypothetical protein